MSLSLFLLVSALILFVVFMSNPKLASRSTGKKPSDSSMQTVSIQASNLDFATPDEICVEHPYDKSKLQTLINQFPAIMRLAPPRTSPAEQDAYFCSILKNYDKFPHNVDELCSILSKHYGQLLSEFITERMSIYESYFYGERGRLLRQIEEANRPSTQQLFEHEIAIRKARAAEKENLTNSAPVYGDFLLQQTTNDGALLSKKNTEIGSTFAFALTEATRFYNDTYLKKQTLLQQSSNGAYTKHWEIDRAYNGKINVTFHSLWRPSNIRELRALGIVE